MNLKVFFPIFRGHPAIDECYDRTRTCLHTGAGPGSSEKRGTENAARDFQEIVIRMISAVILPLLPIYISVFPQYDAQWTSIRHPDGLY